MSTVGQYAAVSSYLVLCRDGKAYCVLLTMQDDCTFELRGAQMWRWLSEWSKRFAAPVTSPATSSSQTSLAFARTPDASSLARTLRRARRR